MLYKRKSGDVLTKEQKDYNNDPYAARARVEHPFGWINHNFESLAKPRLEDELEVNLAISFTAGLYNVVAANKPDRA